MPSLPGRPLPFTQKGDMIHKTLSRDSSSPINQSPSCGVYKALACGWDSGSHRSEGGQRRGTQATLQDSEWTGRKRGDPGRTQDGQGEKDRPSQREGQQGKAKHLRAASHRPTKARGAETDLKRTRSTLPRPLARASGCSFLHPGHENPSLGLGRRPLTGAGSGPRARRRKPAVDPSAAGGGLEGRCRAAPCEPVPRPGG